MGHICKNICERMRAGVKCGASEFKQDYHWCKLCDCYFAPTGSIWCVCCGGKMRTRTHNSTGVGIRHKVLEVKRI